MYSRCKVRINRDLYSPIIRIYPIQRPWKYQNKKGVQVKRKKKGSGGSGSQTAESTQGRVYMCHYCHSSLFGAYTQQKQTFSMQQMIIILRHRLFLAFFYTISDLRLTVTNSSKCSAIEGIFFFNNNSSSSSFYKKKDFLFSLYIFYLFLPFPTDLFVYSFCVLVFFGMVPRTTIIINPSSRATTRATKLEENSKKTTN